MNKNKLFHDLKKAKKEEKKKVKEFRSIQKWALYCAFSFIFATIIFVIIDRFPDNILFLAWFLWVVLIACSFFCFKIVSMFSDFFDDVVRNQNDENKKRTIRILKEDGIQTKESLMILKNDLIRYREKNSICNSPFTSWVFGIVLFPTCLKVCSLFFPLEKMLKGDSFTPFLIFGSLFFLCLLVFIFILYSFLQVIDALRLQKYDNLIDDLSDITIFYYDLFE